MWKYSRKVLLWFVSTLWPTYTLSDALFLLENLGKACNFRVQWYDKLRCENESFDKKTYNSHDTIRCYDGKFSWLISQRKLSWMKSCSIIEEKGTKYVLISTKINLGKDPQR